MKPRKTKPSPISPLLLDTLARAAWHEALARITSGLVHDTNNCLASIVSLSEHCLQLPETQPNLKNELTLINQSGHKAGQILKNFVQLNPFDTPEPTYYDLNALATESVDLLKRVLKRKLELDLQLAPGPLPVFLDGLDLKKAIICLALNLADSISQTGKITFQTSIPADPVPARLYQGTAPKGPTVSLTLSTTAPESATIRWEDHLNADPGALELPSVQDSFLLRFCLVKSTMEKAQGTIACQTSESSGTQFSIFLPKANLD